MGHFLPFYSLKNQKNQNFEKTKKLPKISSFYTKTTMRYSSWDAEWDKHIFLSFWAIFCHFTPLTVWKIKTLKKRKRKKHLEMSSFYTVHQKSQSYDVCFLRDGVWQTSFVILGHFLHFYPNIDPKYENLKKCKKTGDIILLLMCTIYEDHMMYGLFWAILVSFLAIFCPFKPLKGQIIK